MKDGLQKSTPLRTFHSRIYMSVALCTLFNQKLSSSSHGKLQQSFPTEASH